MTTRPHDALFQSVFEAPANATALLRGLLPAAVRAAVAWNTLKSERGSFVDALLADHHSDLLFSARLRTGKPKLVYFLLEHLCGASHKCFMQSHRLCGASVGDSTRSS